MRLAILFVLLPCVLLAQPIVGPPARPGDSCTNNMLLPQVGQNIPVPCVQVRGSGSISRPLNDKLSELPSVKDFGAKCNGVTNDTTAIINAINAICGGTGGVVQFPVGTCMVAPQLATVFLPILSNCTYQGASRSKSILRVIDNAGNYDSLFRGTGLTNVTFKDFTIDQNAAGQLGLTCDTVTSPGCSAPTNVDVGNSCCHTSPSFACNQIPIRPITVTGLTISGMGFDTATGGWAVIASALNPDGLLKANISNNYVNFRRVRVCPGCTENGITCGGLSIDSGALTCCSGNSATVACPITSFCVASPSPGPYGTCPDGTAGPPNACSNFYDQSMFYTEGDEVSITENLIVSRPDLVAWAPNTSYAIAQFVTNGGNFYRPVVPAWGPSIAYTVGQIVQDGPANGQVGTYRCTTAGTSGGTGTRPSAAANPYCTASNCIIDGTARWQYTSTVGTSAASGGPTGINSSIVDNTMTWAYTTAYYDLNTRATTAFEIHGGRTAVVGNTVKNFGILLNAVPSTESLTELAPNNWVIANNSTFCGGSVNLNSENANPTLAPGRNAKNIAITGNSFHFCNADNRGICSAIAVSGFGDASFDGINILGNNISCQRPDDVNNIITSDAAGILLGGNSFILIRGSVNNMVVQGNVISNAPQAGIKLSICKTAGYPTGALVRNATTGLVTVTAPNPSCCINAGACTQVANTCCIIADANGHRFTPGQMVYLTSTDANYPSGYKIVNSIDSGLPSMTWTYSEPAGTGVASTAVATFQSVGTRIKITDNIITDSGHQVAAGLNDSRAGVQVLNGPYQNLDIQRNQISDTSTTATTFGIYALDFRLNPGSINVRTGKNAVNILGTGSFANPVGPLTGLSDTGEVQDTRTFSFAGSGTVTPDPLQFTRHVITETTAASTITIAAPKNAWNGMGLQFTIRNASAGALTVAWNAAFKVAWTNPASGFSASANFVYDGVNNNWLQVGSVNAIPN